MLSNETFRDLIHFRTNHVTALDLREQNFGVLSRKRSIPKRGSQCHAFPKCLDTQERDD